MKRKAALGIMLTLLLVSILTVAFNVAPVTASLRVHIMRVCIEDNSISFFIAEVSDFS